MHPAPCSCHHCIPKPPPAPQRPSGGYEILLPRIVSHERRVLPCLCTELVLPACGCCGSHHRLVSLEAGCEPPVWKAAGPRDNCGRTPVCITLPVSAVLSGCDGNCHTACGVIEADTWLPVSDACAPCAPSAVWILPCIQLLHAEPCTSDGKYAVQLRVTLDIYLLCPEPVRIGRTAPACPQLPLYPPPIHHPHSFPC